MSDEKKRWSWGQFFGWGVGGAIGTGGSAVAMGVLITSPRISETGVLITSPRISETGVSALISIGLIGSVGGLVAGILGYVLSYWWDRTRNKVKSEEVANFQAAALFGVVFSLLITSMLYFSSLSFIIAANPERLNTYVLLVSVISAFASASLKGVINNLRRGQ